MGLCIAASVVDTKLVLLVCVDQSKDIWDYV